MSNVAGDAISADVEEPMNGAVDGMVSADVKASTSGAADSAMVTNVEAPSSGAAEGAMGIGDVDGAEAATDDADETVDAAHVNVVDRDEGAVDAKDIMTGMSSRRDDMFMLWSRDQIFLRARDTNDIGR